MRGKRIVTLAMSLALLLYNSFTLVNNGSSVAYAQGDGEIVNVGDTTTDENTSLLNPEQNTNTTQDTSIPQGEEATVEANQDEPTKEDAVANEPVEEPQDQPQTKADSQYVYWNPNPDPEYDIEGDPILTGGSDEFDGLTPQTPVLSLDKAISIAKSGASNKTIICMNFYSVVKNESYDGTGIGAPIKIQSYTNDTNDQASHKGSFFIVRENASLSITNFVLEANETVIELDGGSLNLGNNMNVQGEIVLNVASQNTFPITSVKENLFSDTYTISFDAQQEDNLVGIIQGDYAKFFDLSQILYDKSWSIIVQDGNTYAKRDYDVSDIYIDGVNGNDKNTGESPDVPIKSIERARKILEKNLNSLNNVYIMDTVTLDKPGNYTFNDLKEGVKIFRYKKCTKPLFLVKSDITLAYHIVDTKQDLTLIQMDSGSLKVGQNFKLEMDIGTRGIDVNDGHLQVEDGAMFLGNNSSYHAKGIYMSGGQLDILGGSFNCSDITCSNADVSMISGCKLNYSNFSSSRDKEIIFKKDVICEYSNISSINTPSDEGKLIVECSLKSGKIEFQGAELHFSGDEVSKIYSSGKVSSDAYIESGEVNKVIAENTNVHLSNKSIVSSVHLNGNSYIMISEKPKNNVEVTVNKQIDSHESLIGCIVVKPEKGIDDISQYIDSFKYTDTENSMLGLIPSKPNIILGLEGIFVDPIDGDDNNDGLTEKTSLKTFNVAGQKIKKEIENNPNFSRYIILTKNNELKENDSLNIDPSIKDVKVWRSHSGGTLLTVDSNVEFTASNVTFSGSYNESAGKTSATSIGIKLNKGAKVNLSDVYINGMTSRGIELLEESNLSLTNVDIMSCSSSSVDCGGIYLGVNSKLYIGGEVKVHNNGYEYGDENKGGGLYLSSGSIIKILDNAVLNVYENSSTYGGGCYLEKDSSIDLEGSGKLNVYSNYGKYGGGIYINGAEFNINSNYSIYENTKNREVIGSEFYIESGRLIFEEGVIQGSQIVKNNAIFISKNGVFEHNSGSLIGGATVDGRYLLNVENSSVDIQGTITLNNGDYPLELIGQKDNFQTSDRALYIESSGDFEGRVIVKGNKENNIKALKQYFLVSGLETIETDYDIEGVSSTDVYWDPGKEYSNTTNDNNDGSKPSKAVYTWKRAKELLKEKTSKSRIVMCSTFTDKISTAYTTGSNDGSYKFDGYIENKLESWNAKIVRATNMSENMFECSKNKVYYFKNLVLSGEYQQEGMENDRTKSIIYNYSDYYTTSADIHISNSTIENSVTNGNATIDIYWGNLIMDSCLVRNNVNTGDKGSIIDLRYSAFQINNCKFENNEAYSLINLYYGNYERSSESFIMNTIIGSNATNDNEANSKSNNCQYGVDASYTKNFSIDNLNVSGNKTSRSGAHLDHCGNYTIKNSIFSYNQNDGLVVMNSFTYSVYDCTFNNNSGDGYADSSNSSFSIYDCTFNNNSKYGLVLTYAKNSQVNNCTADSNKEIGIKINQSSFDKYHMNVHDLLATNNGDGMHLSFKDGEAYNLTARENKKNGLLFECSQGTAKFSGNIISESNGGNGLNCTLKNKDDHMTISNDISISNNLGKGVNINICKDSELEMDNGKITGNKCQNTQEYMDEYGSGVYIEGEGKVTLSNVNVIDNIPKKTSKNGAIYLAMVMYLLITVLLKRMEYMVYILVLTMTQIKIISC